MNNGICVHLDVQQLRSRGWTDALIQRFLGAPDARVSVDHWANYSGKRVFFLERVELAEASRDFLTAFDTSVRRRKLSPVAVEGFRSMQRSTAGDLKAWRESRTGDDIRADVAIRKATQVLEEASRRGFRTPHKA